MNDKFSVREDAQDYNQKSNYPIQAETLIPTSLAGEF